MPRNSARLAAREARAALVRKEVFDTPELKESILGHAISGPHRRPPNAAKWESNLKTYGQIVQVCKDWGGTVRTKDNMRMLLCERSERTTMELSKALALSPAKVKTYPYREGHGIPRAYNFAMPNVFDAILRDHGGWAAVLARSKANALRSLLLEKTRNAKALAMAAEERRASMAEMLSVLKLATDITTGVRPVFTNEPLAVKNDLTLAAMLKVAASRVLEAHSIE